METYKKIEKYIHPRFGASIFVEYQDGSIKCFAERNQSEISEFVRLDTILEKNKLNTSNV